MFFMKRKTQNFIIFAIIALSVYAAVQVVGIPKPKPVTAVLNLEEPRKVFDNAINSQKTIMNFSVAELSEITPKINDILSQEDIKVYYNVRQENSLVTVFDAPREQENDTVSRLREIEGMTNEKTESALIKPGGRIDIESRVNQNVDNLARYRERMKNPNLTTREIGELQHQIQAVQTRIDSLNSVKELEEVKNNPLFMVVISRAERKSGTTSHLRGYVNLAIWTLVFIALFTVAALMITYTYAGIAKLMRVTGIKTAKSGGSRYSYGYGYSYARKRKDKRKHHSKSKDKESDQDEDKETK
jgi:hypothetical protein